jgi:hypothetical protein
MGIESPEQRSSSIGCDASSVASPMGKLYMTTIRTVKIERLSRPEGVSGECRRRLFGMPGPIRGARGRRERIGRIGRRIGLRRLQYHVLSLFVRLCSVLRWCSQVVWRMR